MSELPKSLQQSSRFLRHLLIGFWLGSSVLSTLLLGAVKLLQRHREVIHEAEHVRDVVSASLVVPLEPAKRQAILQALINATRENELNGMNLLLVLNPSGQVVYSSRPSWLGLSITDSLLNRSETNDPDFQALAACFQRADPDCINFSSSNFQIRLGSFTVIRPVELPLRDIGLSREKLLVVANYDPGVVLIDFSQDVVLVLLLSLAGMGLFTLCLAYLLYGRLLPRLTETSQTDGLTQLINRSLFMEKAKELLAEAEERRSEMVFAVLDIDHFKHVNDTYGHSAGDAALTHVAEIFRMVTRPEDLVCRFGGEEFALLLHGSRQSAGRALDRMRLQLEMSRLTYAGHQIKLTASFGAAATADCGYNIDYLYNTADKALYAAKRSGRNRLEWSDGRILSRLLR
ncbi:MAG: GGDEF domain-containing protein [Synechococcus sp.]